MSVTQRLMAPGSWDVKLRPNAPGFIRVSALHNHRYLFGHVFITPSRLVSVDEQALKDNARYVGVVRHVSENGHVWSGAGLAVWLGDEDGKGPIYEASVSIEAGTLDDWITALLPATMPIHKGTVTEPAGALTFTWSFIYMTPRDALNTVSAYFGTEWYIDNEGLLHAGPAGDLFNEDPTVIVSSEPPTNDPVVRGVQPITEDHSTDIEDYASKVLVMTSGFGLDIAVGSDVRADTSPYVDLFGNDVQITKLVDLPELTSVEQADQYASEELIKADLADRITIDTSAFSVPDEVAVGDTVYVYDPSVAGVWDLANEVPYRGQHTWPIKMRVYAQSWPIEAGMGVYLLSKTSGFEGILDLTDWVEFEESATGLVGPEGGISLPDRRDLLVPPETTFKV